MDFQTVVHHQLLQYHQLGLSGMNKSVEFGTHRKYDIGYIKVDKKIYMPTVERLNKWVDIVSKKSWYGKVEFYITGSFTSHVMNIKPFWPTWDIDMIITQENNKELDYDLIKEVLLESVEVALIDCDFWMDLSFQRKKDIWGLNPDESLNTDKTHTVKAIKFGDKGNVELIKDLWEIHREFPLKKHKARNKFGFRYGKPISITEYKEKYYNQKAPV